MYITNKFKFNFNVSEPMKIGNMAGFGLTSTMQTKENYLSLTEALKNNKALVSEVSEKGIACDNIQYVASIYQIGFVA